MTDTCTHEKSFACFLAGEHIMPDPEPAGDEEGDK